MNAPRVLYQMIRADFLERIRRYSFLLTLAAALYLAYGVAAEKVWVVIGHGYRGVYNSAWIGMLMTVCCSTFLSLAGFYIVKNSLQRDSDTRVGRILAATPMRKGFYTVAKTLSNFAVLACMVAVLMLAALAMQWLRAEARPIAIWKLWAPFLLVAFPAMLLVSSLAVLFETLPVLRGGIGNMLYFFLWTAGLALGAEAGVDDPTGLQLLYRSTRAALTAADPTTPPNFSFSLTIGGERAIRTFYWDGIDWTPRVLGARLLWAVISLAIALLAAVFFHRFDPAREWMRFRAKTPATKAAGEGAAPAVQMNGVNRMPAHLSPLAQTPPGGSFFRLVGAELKLMLKGKRWWWYAVAGGLAIACLVSPLEDARGGVLIAAWIWPILVWSPMGSREARHGTQSLIFSSAGALPRQLPATWAAGVLVAALTGGGVGLRVALSGDVHGFATWLAGAFFIPSLALALGVWSGSSKAFEALYTVWWYIGPAHHSPGLDFMGTRAASSTPGTYAVAAMALLAVSVWGRRAHLGYA